MALICISLNPNEVEYFFHMLIDHSYSFLYEGFVQLCLPTFKNWVFILLISCRSSLYLVVQIVRCLYCIYFLPFCRLLVDFLICLIRHIKVLIFMNSYLLMFPYHCYYVLYSKKSLLTFSSQKYSLVISFTSFIILYFTFRFIFHHRLVFVDCVMCHK